jgi:hypothetical protein
MLNGIPFTFELDIPAIKSGTTMIKYSGNKKHHFKEKEKLASVQEGRLRIKFIPVLILPGTGSVIVVTMES